MPQAGYIERAAKNKRSFHPERSFSRASTKSEITVPTCQGGYAEYFWVDISGIPVSDETSLCGFSSMAMLFSLCGIHSSLQCPGRFEFRVNRISDGTRSVGRELALRGVHSERCTYRGARWQRTLSVVYSTEFYNSRHLCFKTGFFAVHDQVRNSPPEWEDGFEGFAKRVGTRQTQFLLQNSFTSLGNAMVGWEPRYDRCKCEEFWLRTRHAIVRNFVTYDRSENTCARNLCHTSDHSALESSRPPGSLGIRIIWSRDIRAPLPKYGSGVSSMCSVSSPPILLESSRSIRNNAQSFEPRVPLGRSYLLPKLQLSPELVP
jgi:hypothetical protein